MMINNRGTNEKNNFDWMLFSDNGFIDFLWKKNYEKSGGRGTD